MARSGSKKILIVPLDWGLGHTTRCIPIINILLDLGHEVHIGGTLVTNGLLQSEFPTLTYHIYPSYGISYPEDGNKFLKHIIKLVPQIAKVVRAEKKLTQSLNKEFSFDVIISDNRFGVRATNSMNIFISHQLNLSVPQSEVSERVVNWINTYFINKYDRVGVPDWESRLLSGSLSDGFRVKKEIVYLGSLSRWYTEIKEKNINASGGLLVLLSGPEPQRTILEKMLVTQAIELQMSITIVRAKPNGKTLPQHEGVTFYNHLTANELKELALSSAMIISRAGYTTIMDLVAIKKHAVLIPTPGQTEQEYLADHLNDMRLFTFLSQESFSLSKAIEEFNKMRWGVYPKTDNNLKEKIIELIE